MGCGCSKVAPVSAPQAVSRTSSKGRMEDKTKTGASPKPAPAQQVVTVHKSPPAAQGSTDKARGMDGRNDSSSEIIGRTPHPNTTRGSLQMPEPTDAVPVSNLVPKAETEPKPFEEEVLQAKLLQLQKQRELEEEKEKEKEKEKVNTNEEKGNETKEETEPVDEEEQALLEMTSGNVVAEVDIEVEGYTQQDEQEEEKEKKKESNAKKKGKILIQVQLKNNPEYMEMKMKPNQIYLEDLARWSDAFWGVSNLLFSIVENDEIIQVTEEDQLRKIIEKHGLVDEPLIFYARPNQQIGTIAESPEPEKDEPAPAAETAKEPTPDESARIADRPAQDVDIDLSDDKQATTHVHLINDDGTESFCHCPAETSFWDFTRVVRSAYGHPICFRATAFSEPLTTPAQFEALLKEYQESKEKYLTLYAVHISDLDIETVDEFEHIYEEKKTSAFIRCKVDDDEPFSCMFPLPLTFEQLYNQLKAIGDGITSLSLKFADIDEVSIHNDEQFQEILRSYQLSLYKYLDVTIVNRPPIDEDTEEDIIHEKRKKLHFLVKVDDIPLDMICPSDVQYDDFVSQLKNIVNGLFKLSIIDESSKPTQEVSDNETFSKVIQDFKTTAVPMLTMEVVRLEEPEHE